MKGFALFLALLPLAASAATITVTTTADNTTPGNGQCTLREAIANVNAAADMTSGDCTAGSGAGDTIKFALGMPAKIRLKLDELLIQRDVSIENRAPGSLHIDGFGRSRVFEIAAGRTAISGVTIERGHAFAAGGGILVRQGAMLDMVDCTLAGNSVTTGISDDDEVEIVGGGGIYNAGTIVLTHCALTRNRVFRGLGFPDFLVGGGLFNDAGTATLIDCLVNGNRVTADEDSGDTYGGGLYNLGGSVTLDDCTVTGNMLHVAVDTNGAGGGISTNEAIGAFGQQAGALALTGCRIVRNRIIGPPHHDFAGAFGGGIENEGSIVTLSDSTVSRNTVLSGNDGGADGGGISNEYGTMTLTRCTADHNVALLQGTLGESFGGGIENEDRATLILTDCTIAGNVARSCSRYYYCDAGGGGIYTTGQATLTQCTLSGNTVWGTNEYEGVSGGAIMGSALVTNSIVANSGAAGDCDGFVDSGGHNLGSDASCFAAGGTDFVNVRPQLAPLANNGGPTQTMALCTAPGIPAGCRAASPALDTGDDAVTGPPDNLTTDQRGLPRLPGAHVDIGAYEVQ